MKLVILLAFVGLVYGASVKKNVKFGQEMVDHVNGLKDGTFKARRYPLYLEERFKKHSKFVVKTTAQLESDHQRIKREVVPKETVGDDTPIPDNFDISENWPQCAKVFKRLIDQGTCMAGTNAVGITGMITDRRCIRSNGSETIPISAWDMITCCETPQCKSGIDMCTGTTNLDVYQQYVDYSGISTGGAFETEKFKSHGCKPWPLDATTDHTTLNKTCNPKCRPEYTARTYTADKRKGRAFFGFDLDATTEQQAQREIMNRGSVMMYVQISNDFFQYSSGIYQNVGAQNTDQYYGSIMVRLQGWGVDSSGVKYWRGPFTYGKDWGEDGYVRIIRGKYDSGTQAIQAVRAYYD